jgi:hypothetical protein
MQEETDRQRGRETEPETERQGEKCRKKKR